MKTGVLVLVAGVVAGLVAVLGLAGPVNAGLSTLSTPQPDSFENTDGLGGFFDLTAIKTVNINSFEFYTDADANQPFKMDLFSRSGANAGHTGSAAGWSVLQSLSGTSDGNPATHNMNLTTPLTISAGSTVGFYMRGTTGGMRWNDDGSPETLADANLAASIFSSNVNFNDETADTFKELSLSVNYSTVSAPPPPQPPPTGIPLPNTGLAGLAMLPLLALAVRRWGVRLL